MPAKKPKTPDFEKSLEALEKILAEMESGKLNLDDSLKAFERGVKLSAECQQALAEAEQRISLLSETGEETDFAGHDKQTDG